MADYIKWLRSKVGKEKVITIALVAFLKNEQGQVLLQKRRDSELWDLPGGIMELGETFEEALTREVFEETGNENFEIIKQFGHIIGENLFILMEIRFRLLTFVFLVKSKKQSLI